MSDLDDLVRRHYETGEFGRAHLRMAESSVNDLKARLPEPDPPMRPPLHTIMGIPIVIDESLPHGAWRIADNSTGRTLREGIEISILRLATQPTDTTET